MPTPFRDRSDAGSRLAAALASYRGDRPIILALPRGGVPVAAEIADALDADLDIIVVRKIGAPGQPELALGAVVDGGQPITVRNEDIIRQTGTTEDEFATVRDQELAEIERRRARYLGSRPYPDLAGKVVIIVDDGIATGATVEAAVRAIRRRGPRELVLAVPVASAEVLDRLRADVDSLVCLRVPRDFRAVGQFYRDFRQVTDDEVIAALHGRVR